MKLNNYGHLTVKMKANYMTDVTGLKMMKLVVMVMV